jgi:hypothetical protein
MPNERDTQMQQMRLQRTCWQTRAGLRRVALVCCLPLTTGCVLDEDLLSAWRPSHAGPGDPAHAGSGGAGSGGAAGGGAAGGGSGTQQPTTLAEGAFRLLAIAPPHLYVVDESISRLPTEGGPLEPISAEVGSALLHLVADDVYLYGAVFQTPTRTQLWRLPLSGGGFSVDQGGVLLGEARSVVALDVNATHLVSLEGRPTPSTVQRDLTRFDRQAGGAERVATLPLLFSNAFALDGSDAYVVQGLETEAAIVSVPISGGEPTPLIGVEPDETFLDLAVEGDAVEGDQLVFGSSTRVGQVSASDGESLLLSPTRAYRVLGDEEFAYFFTAASGCPSGSDLYRVPLGGGLAVPLANEPEPGCVVQVVADADALYWLSPSGDRIRKQSKR